MTFVNFRGFFHTTSDSTCLSDLPGLSCLLRGRGVVVFGEMRCKIVWNICELGKGWSNKCANWPEIYSVSLVADCWLKSGKGLIRRVSHYLQEVFQPPIQNLPSWHAELFGYWLAVCYTRFTKRTWNPPKLVVFPIPKAFFSGEDLKMGKLKHEIALMFEKKAIVPSRQLTYPIPRHFWRWFSFSQGGIC